ncbi:MAG: hypothetical protein H7318_06650 [Oligoflexus sp.]|nr:hypothetical protein [Oligoflexus sp.]
MKAKILYAPVLLLSLSMACGKAEKSSVSSPGLDNLKKAAQKIDAVAHAHPVVAEETAPTPAPTPDPAPATTNTPSTTPAVTPVAGTPSETDADSAEAPVPANAATNNSAEEAAPITSGVPDIDKICAKSYLAVQAATQEEFNAVGLNATVNGFCQKALLSAGAKVVTELTNLGVSLGLPTGTGTGTVPLTPALFSNVLSSNPEYGDLFLQVIDTNVFYNETYFLPDANEKLEYVKTSIAEISARNPSDLTVADKSNLMTLNLSLEVQQGTVDKFNKRIEKLGSLANLTSLSAGVGFVGQMLAAPAVAPTAASGVNAPAL